MREHQMSTGESSTVTDTFCHRVLMGGDQLTSMRGRGAQSIRQNGGDAITCLEGLHMFSLDWHTKMNFLEVRDAIFITILLNRYIQHYFTIANLEVLLY